MVPKFDRAGADDDPATGKEQLRGSENEAVVGVGTVSATTLRPGENCHYKALKEFHYRISAIRSGRNSRKTACTLCS